MRLSARRARKIRDYVIRKMAMKRELEAYFAASYAAEAASSDRWQL